MSEMIRALVSKLGIEPLEENYKILSCLPALCIKLFKSDCKVIQQFCY